MLKQVQHDAAYMSNIIESHPELVSGSLSRLSILSVFTTSFQSFCH